MYENPLKIAQKYWGFTSFRKPQEEIISAVIQNNDVLTLLPTGGGKSLCFQVPALIKKGICIVISPLLALMEDQVNSLVEKNIKATTIPSESTQDEIITLFDNLRYGNYKFLYVSPERLQSTFIQDKIRQLNVSLIAVDEAHCISEWGHDFRPSYKNIQVVRDIHPQVPIIALTASATKKVIADITTSLQLKDVKIFKKSFYRDNLAYQIHQTDDKLYKLKQIFTKTRTPAIVYVNTRSKTKKISAFLNANGFKSGFYHGGLSPVEKKIAFINWMNEETPIIVATNAFGMGIDKPNVGIVIHYNLPNSIENYVQEAGRAGRNGKKAFSVVLTNKSDILSVEELQKKSFPSLKKIKKIHKKLYQNFQIAKGELIETPFEFNFLEFCNKYDFSATKTFNALQILHNNGIIRLHTNFQQKSTIQFLVNSPQILQYTTKNSPREHFIKLLLRMYGGLFEQAVTIDEFYLAKKAGITSWNVIHQLEKLTEEGLIDYKKASKNAELFFLHPREDNKTINRIAKNIESYLVQKEEKITRLVDFIKDTSTCRSIQLLQYFGESSSKNCGMCDVCLQRKTTIKNISYRILKTIQQYRELSSREICELISEKEEDILIHLRTLLAEEKIGLTNYNKYYVKITTTNN